MGLDDDADCLHDWVLVALQLEDEGAYERYDCTLCGAMSLRPIRPLGR